MTHDALVNVAATAHAAVLVGAVAALYKFGDRTEILARSLQGVDSTLRELRRLIASDLADWLKSDLSDQSGTATRILVVSTETYVERPSDPFAGERYRESVRRFVEERQTHLVDCRSLLLSRGKWSAAARRLSWFVLSLAIYQAVVAGVLAFIDRTGVHCFANGMVEWAAAPTAILVVACGLSLVQMLLNHDAISEICQRYADTST